MVLILVLLMARPIPWGPTMLQVRPRLPLDVLTKLVQSLVALCRSSIVLQLLLLVSLVAVSLSMALRASLLATRYIP